MFSSYKPFAPITVSPSYFTKLPALPSETASELGTPTPSERGYPGSSDSLRSTPSYTPGLPGLPTLTSSEKREIDGNPLPPDSSANSGDGSASGHNHNGQIQQSHGLRLPDQGARIPSAGGRVFGGGVQKTKTKNQQSHPQRFMDNPEARRQRVAQLEHIHSSLMARQHQSMSMSNTARREQLRYRIQKIRQHWEGAKQAKWKKVDVLQTIEE